MGYQKKFGKITSSRKDNERALRGDLMVEEHSESAIFAICNNVLRLEVEKATSIGLYPL